MGSETEVSEPAQATVAERRKNIRREAKAAREEERTAKQRAGAAVTESTAQAAFTSFGDLESTAALVAGDDKIGKAVDSAVFGEKTVTGYNAYGKLAAQMPFILCFFVWSEVYIG